MLVAEASDHDVAGLVTHPPRDLQQIRVGPQRLHVDEVDAVFGPIALALCMIELELHVDVDPPVIRRSSAT